MNSAMLPGGKCPSSKLHCTRMRPKPAAALSVVIPSSRFAQEAIDKCIFKARDPAKGHWVPDVPKILQTAAEIAGAMAYLHSHDVLHSDLNGNNILLSSGDDSLDFTAKVGLGGPNRSLGLSCVPPARYHAYK